MTASLPPASEPAALLGSGLDASPEQVVRLRLGLSYDGTDFSGWAHQPGLRTVQGQIEAALTTILHLAPPAELTVAGRTDAGVHARGQVAHVDVPEAAWQRWKPSLLRRLAGVLPRDVRVASVTEAAPGFDARFAALSRRYCYRLDTSTSGPDPLRRHEVLWHARPLDVDAMNAAAELLLGEHDFGAFCRRRPNASTIRALAMLHCRREGELVSVDVAADAFCHSMVRALVGGLTVVGEGRRPASWPAEVLATAVRDSAVPVLPAHGLTLEEVCYPPDADLSARAATTRRPRVASAKLG